MTSPFEDDAERFDVLCNAEGQHSLWPARLPAPAGWGRLIELFALPIPSQMISEMLGVPYTERAAFQARAKRQLDVMLSPEESVALGREARAYMRSLVERAKASPGEDILSSLVREHLDELDETTLVNLGDLILTAGHQTTSSMLGLSVYTLLREPEQLAWLRNNPDRMDTAVEELLRYLSVVTSGPPRVATEDVEIGGTVVPRGRWWCCPTWPPTATPRWWPIPNTST